MTKNNTLKKGDWHQADVLAALKKNGWSLRALSKAHGYKNLSTLGQVFVGRWPKGQAIIADAIGVPPEEIWPSRYEESTRSPINKKLGCRHAA